jgi:thiosulfate/3-mercaptopyruvate sulfurtransferase
LATTRRRFLATGGALLAGAGLPIAGCGAAAEPSRPAAAGSPAAPAAPAGATPVPPGAFANPGLAVSAAWLRDHAADAGLRIVDARAAADYARGHIAGAVSLPVADTFDPAQPGNYPDSKEKLEALFGARGIANATRVVVYDAGAETPGPRLFWTLEYLGQTGSAVLDGGLKAWQAAGGAVSTETPTVPPATYTAAVDPSRIYSQAQCALAITDRTKVVVDARSPEEYRGEDVRAPFGGHIPGAVNIDYRENFAPDGRLKDAAALRALYVAKGVTPDKEVIGLCQTGQRSTVDYWVLRLLGYPKVGNYGGGWIEWGSDPQTSKAQGAS